VSDLDRADHGPDVPRFAWWIVILITGMLALSIYVWRAGYVDYRVSAAKKRALQ
jgi:hypothetical protein